MQSESTQASGVGPAIFAGCVITFIGFGFAAGFGVLLRPLSEELGWAREVFSLSMAVQALFWGFTQPFAGMVADRFGTARVLAFGAIVSAIGFFLRAEVSDPTLFVWTGVIIGIGTGACAFPVVLVALGKLVPPERRSYVLGLGTAAASVGMVVAAPMTRELSDLFDVRTAIHVVAAGFLMILPFLLLIARVSRPTATQSDGGFGHAITTAFGERAYVLLFTGFFVCGFHVAFIQTHLPAFIEDRGLGGTVAAWSLGIIGLFNIAGSFGAGWIGQHYSKRTALAVLYTGRAATITVFMLVPLTPMSVYIFSAVMGIVWLSAIPLTTGLVAQTQGLKFLSTLVGLIFLGHQVGSFIGAWLGGLIFDVYGDYSPMWWAAVVLGLIATALHIPIDERPGRLAREAAA
ncbi:MAG: MFS transporter [Pseudomonadota bacterium]